MSKFIFAIFLLFSLSVNATVRVAILDTGKPIITDAPVCKEGSKDFSGLGITDTHGHAGHIADVIDQHVKGKIRTSYSSNFDNSKSNSTVGYCLIFLKYYNEQATGAENLRSSNAAWKHAVKLKVDVIVYAGGGAQFDYEESNAVVAALNKGIKIIAAAGNEGVSTDLIPYFPAQYDNRVTMVGNLTTDFITGQTKRGPLSNYGKRVNAWEIGTGVIGKVNGIPTYMTGTSMATAVKAGKMVRELLKDRRQNGR